VNEPIFAREGDALDRLHEEGKRRAESVPEFDLEETLRVLWAVHDADAYASQPRKLTPISGQAKASQPGKRTTQISGPGSNVLAVDIAESTPADRASGQVCAMLAVDIAGSTRADRDDEIQLYLRTSLYGILREALGGSGMPWEQNQYEDRGDGILVIIPPDLAAQPIIDSLPDRLRGLIRRHNHVSREPARMQLRVAAHIGPVYCDEHGFVGDDVTFLCRMLDAQPLRRALSESGAEVAFIVSDYVYEKLVRRRRSLADPRSFRSVRIQVKRTPVHAWIYLPGGSPP
jgi:class 3 adenylate cyclase